MSELVGFLRTAIISGALVLSLLATLNASKEAERALGRDAPPRTVVGWSCHFLVWLGVLFLVVGQILGYWG